jgi:LPXTG-site transpeptidase (sortase) family protein
MPSDIKKSLALLTLLVGISLVILVTLPLAVKTFDYSWQSHNRLLDPTETRGNVLGLAVMDYLDTASPSASSVKYFTLSVPSLKMSDVTVEVNGTNLDNNAIHLPGTALPGRYGNVVIFGHSALPGIFRAKSPKDIFNPIPDIKLNSEIVINFDGATYRYQVRKTVVTSPDNYNVLLQDFSHRELTLITCVPLGTYWHRFVARAELIN